MALSYPWPSGSVRNAGDTLELYQLDFDIELVNARGKAPIDDFCLVVEDRQNPWRAIWSGLSGGFEAGTETESLLYRFRDNVLAQSERGKRYIDLFYKHLPALDALLSSDQELRSRVEGMLQRHLASIRSLVNGQEMAVSEADLKQIEDLLESLAEKSEPQFQAVLQRLRRDLQDPKALKELGIRVECSTDKPCVEVRGRK